jgi:hypothetical protein
VLPITVTIYHSPLTGGLLYDIVDGDTQSQLSAMQWVLGGHAEPVGRLVTPQSLRRLLKKVGSGFIRARIALMKLEVRCMQHQLQSISQEPAGPPPSLRRASPFRGTTTHIVTIGSACHQLPRSSSPLALS